MKKERSAQSEEKPEDHYLKNFALSAVGKFILDFDPNLSINDIEELLVKYAPTYNPKIIAISVSNQAIPNAVEEKIIKVPNLKEIEETLRGTDIAIQAGILLDYESIGMQAFPEASDRATQAKPSEKTK